MTLLFALGEIRMSCQVVLCAIKFEFRRKAKIFSKIKTAKNSNFINIRLCKTIISLAIVGYHHL